MRSREIQEETEDRFVLVDNVMTRGDVLFVSVKIAATLFFSWWGISWIWDFALKNSGAWHDERLFGLVFGLALVSSAGLFMFDVLHTLLIKESVTVDRRLQSVIIERGSTIKYLKSIEKVNFADIKCAEIKIYIEDGSETRERDVSLITIHGAHTKIYAGDCEIAEKVGKKVCDITDKPLSHRQYSYSTASTG